MEFEEKKSKFSDIAVKVKEGLKKSRKLIVLILVLITIGVAGTSLFNQYVNQKPKVVKKRIVRKKKVSKQGTLKKHTTASYAVSEKKENCIPRQTADSVLDEVKKNKELAYLYSIKTEALKKKLEYLKIKREIEKLEGNSNTLIQRQGVGVENLRIRELERKIKELERKFSNKEKNDIKKKLQQFILKSAPHEKEKKHIYRLIAIFNDKAVIERDGKRVTIRNGEEIDGKKVLISSGAVKIGNQVLTFSFGETQSVRRLWKR